MPIRPERLLALVPGVVVLPALAFADGGYFRSSWAPAILAFACLAGFAALVARPKLDQLALAWLVSWALLTGWIALTSIWSEDGSASLREGERALVYLAAVAALALLARLDATLLLGGLLAGSSLVCLVSLGRRLFPDEPLRFDPFEGTLLAKPLGYANALGILAAMTLLVAVGVAATGRDGRARAAGAALAPPLAAVLVLTDSRGAWLAAGLGGLAGLALAPARARTAAGAALVLVPAAAAAALALQADALRRELGPLAEAQRQGRLLALALVLLAGVGALLVSAAPRLEPLFRRRAVAVIAVVVIAAAAALALGAAAAGRAHGAAGDRPEYWRVAWHEAKANPIVGSGAGTFELWWQDERPIDVDVRDAHSLYLEAFAEQGAVGLLLLLGALVLPLVGAARRRGSPLVAVAASAYTAFLIHAAVDWDWEMPAVTVAGLIAAAVLVAPVPRSGEHTARSWSGVRLLSESPAQEERT